MLVEDDGCGAMDNIVDLSPEAPTCPCVDPTVRQQKISLHQRDNCEHRRISLLSDQTTRGLFSTQDQNLYSMKLTRCLKLGKYA